MINVSITGQKAPFLDENDEQHFLRIPVHDCLYAQLLPYFDQAYAFIGKSSTVTEKQLIKADDLSLFRKGSTEQWPCFHPLFRFVVRALIELRVELRFCFSWDQSISCSRCRLCHASLEALV